MNDFSDLGLFPNTNARRLSSASEDFSVNKRRPSVGTSEATHKGRQRLGSLQLSDARLSKTMNTTVFDSTLNGTLKLNPEHKENRCNSTAIGTLQIPTSPGEARLNFNQTILNQLRVVWIPKWVDYSNK